MRTLKKTLSFVLVLALILSVCIFSASASNFTDSNQIQHNEAVDVLTEIGVIDGMGDGSFNPTGMLTRAQAAKILCYMLLSSDISKLDSNTSSFTDVIGTPEEWAAPYIEYCYNAGIVGGYGDGRFGPADSLTGYQFAKMLLCALGYDANIEGYTGPTWTVAVAKGIIDASLDDGLPGGYNYNGSITRDEACQIAFNALKADMVEYNTKGTTIVTGDGTTVVTGASTATPKTTSQNYGSNIDARIDPLTGNWYLQFGEYYFHDLKRTAAGTPDDFGRPSNTWKYKNNEIGTYTDTINLVTFIHDKATLSAIYEAVGRNTVKDLEAGNALLWVYMDGINLADGTPLGATPVAAANVAQYMKSNDTSTFSSPFNDGQRMGNNIDATGAGSVTEIYIDDTLPVTEVTIVVTNEYLLKATGDFAKDELKVALENTGDFGAFGTPTMALANTKLNQNDFNNSNLSGYKTDDYMVATMAADRMVGTVYQMNVKSVDQAITVQGNVNKFVKNVNKVEFGSITIDGTNYTYALMCPYNDGYGSNYTVDRIARVITDANGYILYVDEATVTNNYCFIYQFVEESGLERTAHVIGDAFLADLDSDISIKIDEVKDSAGNKIPGATLVAGGGFNWAGWYSYSADSDGTYDLRQLSNQFVVNYGNNTNVLANGKTAFIIGVAQSGNSDTVTIVNDDANDETTWYIGASKAPDLRTTATGTSTVYYHLDSKGLVDYCFTKVLGSAVIDDGSFNNDLVYILFNDGTANDGKNNVYTQVESIQKGAWAWFNVKDGMFNPLTDCFQLVYKVKTNSDGYVTGWTTIEDAVTINGKGDKYYYFDGFNMFGGDNFQYDKGTLSFAGESLDVSNADIYLIIVEGPTTDDIVDDPGMPADFTNLHINGDQVKNVLNGYDVIAGSVAGVRADENSSVVSSLYITIFAVQPS